jgi:hypothetical protein
MFTRLDRVALLRQTVGEAVVGSVSAMARTLLVRGGRGGVSRPLAVATGLFVATLLSRLPFVSQHLWAWDSVLYARALEDGFHVDYALAGQRPHPPGYLLYVATAAVARLVTLDSNAALVAVSAIASALAVAALFLFARRLVPDDIAAIAALGFALDPLVWQYSVVAYPYTLLSLLSIALVACFVACRTRDSAAVIATSTIFGLAAGFRQDLLLVLAPLWLWTLWDRPWRVRAAATAALCAGCLVWLVPTALLSGGLLPYAEALFRQGDYVRATYSVFSQGLPALGANFATTLYALAWGLGLFAIPLVALAVAGARQAIRARRMSARRISLGRTDALLILWIAPALALYVVLHIGEWGYVLSVLPGLYVLAAIGVSKVMVVPRAALRVTFAALVIAPALVFTTSAGPFSAAAVAQHDAEVVAHVAYVRGHYPAQRTLILAREDFLLVRYYLPEYRVWFHDPDPFRSTLRRKRTPKVTAMVVFTRGLQASSSEAHRVECGKGVQLVHLAIEPGSIVELYGERFSVADALR